VLHAGFERRIRRVPIGAGPTAPVVRVGTLRAHVGWRRALRFVAATGVSLPVGVEAHGRIEPVKGPLRLFGVPRPLFAGARVDEAAEAAASPTAAAGAGACDGDHETEENGPMDESQTLEAFYRPASYPAEKVGEALLVVANGEGAVGPSTVVGDRTVIPLTETMFSGGFGTGGGGGLDAQRNVGGGSGGGGGGGGRTRTIALAVVGPDGIEIKPVVDWSGLVLAALTTLATLGTRSLLGRRRR
jgi:uncharacterized spore protein YtfJ